MSKQGTTSAVELAKFIDQAQESSRRVRTAALALTVASVIIGASVWNQRPGEWFRNDLRELAARISRQEESLLELKKGQAASGSADVDIQQQQARLDGLRSLYQGAQMKLLERLFFEVDFFGVGFHVNDLGVIGGLSLACLCFLLTSTLRLQLRNYREVFRRASLEGSLEDCYRLLAMAQVLSAPPSLDGSPQPLTRQLRKMYLLMPLAVQAGVVYVDIQTLDLVADVKTWASFNVTVGSAFLLLIVGYTVLAGGESFRYDALWKETVASLTAGPTAQSVAFAEKGMTVMLHDGRALSVPLDWYPRLDEGSDAERGNWHLSAAGKGVHWPDLDEGVSVDDLLMGRRSGETKRSLSRWRASRLPPPKGAGRLTHR